MRAGRQRVHAVAKAGGLGEALGLEPHGGLQVHRVEVDLRGVRCVAHGLDPVHVDEAQEVGGVGVERALADEAHVGRLVEEAGVRVVAVHERGRRPLARFHGVEAVQELVDAGLGVRLLGDQHVHAQRCQDGAVVRVARRPRGAGVVEDVPVDEPERTGRRRGSGDQNGGEDAGGEVPESRLGGHGCSGQRCAMGPPCDRPRPGPSRWRTNDIAERRVEL